MFTKISMRLGSSRWSKAIINKPFKRFSSNLIIQPDDPLAPELHIRWFYAADNPKSMPDHYHYKQSEPPRKFVPFSIYDSCKLEKTYQNGDNGLISVNEDNLFEVDLSKREMKPVYWDGAIYEIRRGSWFDNGNPVEESMATQLEKGYLRIKPYETHQNNPLSNNDVHVINDKKILYSDNKSAYVLNKGYGGKLQLSYLKAVKNLPSIGATLLSRGFEDRQEDSSTFNLSDMFTLELNQLFGEKTGNLSRDEQDANTKTAMKLEIEQDYKSKSQEFKGGDRQVDHLIFCIHGIGQMLGTKFQAVNFTHTVNVLRRNLKKVYSNNKEFQQLLKDEDNCRIQVLPITWRHKVDFTTDKTHNDQLPSLADVTVDEFKPMRNLLGSVLFDVLLYYEPLYMNQILDEVVLEANRQYHLFKEKNPGFKGSVSIVGHSLGSAIALDLLSLQPDSYDVNDPKHFHFKVENYFGMGSPVGVFNVLKRNNIAPRSLKGPSTDDYKTLACRNYYNIFHPCDPIGYRVEPLIRTEFKDYEPESVPFLIEDFNKQLSYLAKVGDSLTKRMTDYVSTVNITKLMSHKEESPKEEEKNKEVVIHSLSKDQLKTMTAMNYNGRVDYALQQGFLELSIVSGVIAHTSYFEDENVAAFLLKETLTRHDPVGEKSVKKRL